MPVCESSRKSCPGSLSMSSRPHTICAQDVWSSVAWQHASFLASRTLRFATMLVGQVLSTNASGRCGDHSGEGRVGAQRRRRRRGYLVGPGIGRSGNHCADQRRCQRRGKLPSPAGRRSANHGGVQRHAVGDSGWKRSRRSLGVNASHGRASDRFL